VRKHPLMAYRGQKNWPPVWLWTGRGENKHPHGEVGVLKEVHIVVADPLAPANPRPYYRVYLFMDYRKSSYVGCLLFDDASACRQIGEILKNNCGKSLEEIGAIDLSQLL